MLTAPPDSEIRDVLNTAQAIAIVGLSPKPERPSNGVARYLITAGYRLYPVNPGQSEILSRPCYADLSEVPERVALVNIFRKAEDTPALVAMAVAQNASAVWLQQGIISHESAEIAHRAGLFFIMDRCLKIEHRRLNIISKKFL